jgi:hypothetical protein
VKGVRRPFKSAEFALATHKEGHAVDSVTQVVVCLTQTKIFEETIGSGGRKIVSHHEQRSSDNLPIDVERQEHDHKPQEDSGVDLSRDGLFLSPAPSEQCIERLVPLVCLVWVVMRSLLCLKDTLLRSNLWVLDKADSSLAYRIQIDFVLASLLCREKTHYPESETSRNLRFGCQGWWLLAIDGGSGCRICLVVVRKGRGVGLFARGFHRRSRNNRWIS